MNRLVKTGVIITGAMFLSTVGIFASDAIRGVQSQFASIGGTPQSGVCNQGAVPMQIEGVIICVDIYEASPSEQCPRAEVSSQIQTEENSQAKDCFPASVKDATPWNFISLSQAQRMCAVAGKRLPTSKEWYAYTLGVSPDSCVIASESSQKTGSSACVSSVGVYDSVGNVWEWVNENIVNSEFEGRKLPAEGYVTSVDAHGVPISSSESADALYGSDYFWSKSDGVFGMIRGGFYGSGLDAGLYSINASVPTSFSSQGVGFRCVKDVL